MSFISHNVFKEYEPLEKIPDNQSEIFEAEETTKFTSRGDDFSRSYVYDNIENTLKQTFGINSDEYLKFIHPNLISEDTNKRKLYRDLILERTYQPTELKLLEDKSTIRVPVNNTKKLEFNMFMYLQDLKEKYPDIQELQSLPTDYDEMEYAKETAKQSIALQAEELRVKGVDKTSAELGGMALAQIKDPINLIALAIPFGGVGKGVSLGKFLFNLGWQGSASITVSEFFQQTDARKRAKEMGIAIENPEMQEYLTNLGIDFNTLIPNREELNDRLLLAAAVGLIGTPVLGGSFKLLGKLLSGDRVAKNVLQNEIEKTVSLTKGIDKELPADQYINHLDKILEKMQLVTTKAGSAQSIIKPISVDTFLNTKSIDDIAMTKEVDDILNQTEKTFNIKFNKTQRDRLNGLIKIHDFDIKRHNQIIRMSNILDNQKNYKFKFGESDIQVSNVFDSYAKLSKFKLKESLQKHIQKAFDGKTKAGRIFRPFGNKAEYTKSLPDPKKNYQAYKEALLEDHAILEILSGLLNNHKLNPDATWNKLFSDVIEPSFGRQLGFSNDYYGRVQVTLNEMVKMLDDPKFYNFNPRKQGDMDVLLNKAIAGIFGETVNDPIAATFSKNLQKMFDYSRDQLNAYGANIGKLKNYFPQGHDIDKILKHGNKQGWIESTLSRLDKEKTARNLGIIDDTIEVGADIAPYEKQLIEQLDIVYDRILDGDMIGALAKKRAAKNTIGNAQHRYLVFKNSKEWLDYADEFGKNPYQALHDYINKSSREISMLRTFGPDSEQTFTRLATLANQLEDITRKGTGGKEGLFAGKGYNKGIKEAQKMFDHISGKEFVPESAWEKGFSKFNTELRGIMISSKLGAAFLASLADFSYGGVTRNINGMPITGQVQNYVKMFRGNEQQARAAKVVGDMFLDDIRAGARIHGELMGTGIFSRFSNKLMKISGLESGTLAARKAFRYEFQIHMGRIANQNYADINKNTKVMMKRYGINEDDFNKMKSIKLTSDIKDKQVKYLTIADIDDADLKFKLSRWMSTESLIAVPTMTIRSRAAMMAGTKPGTVSGEAVRHFMLFKNFPITIIATQANRMINGLQGHSRSTKLIYGTSVVTSTTLMGTAILQFKRMMTGKDPLPMNAKTLTAGFTLGGAGGLISDLIFYDPSHYGGNRYTNLLGPTVPFLNDATNFVLSPIIGPVFEGKPLDESMWWSEKNLAKGFQFLERNAPFTNLWYTRLAKERFFTDLVNESLDPEFNRKKALRETKERKNYGSGYWWRRGHRAPDRSPDIKNITRYFEK